MLFGNEYNWLVLEQLIDTPDNNLFIVISQTKEIKPCVNRLKHEENKKNRGLLSEKAQLVSDDEHMYRINFKNYLMYQDRNESYCCYDADEIGIGRGLILFEKSKLLDYVNGAIDVHLAMDMHKKAELQHYGIYTLNNIVDVITFYEPIIEKVNRRSIINFE